MSSGVPGSPGGPSGGPSGRSGAPGGRSYPEPARDPRDPRGQIVESQPITDLPALPFDSLPPQVGRMPFDANERGAFWPADDAPHPPDSAGEQISGLAAAQLFGQAPRSRPAPNPPQGIQPRLSGLSGLRPPGQLAPLTAPTSAPVVTASVVSVPETIELTAERERAQTLTQQMRTMQPPDVARQAINELHVLAGELITLAHDLEQSGLARMHARAYLDTARRYGELARLAWLSVATERLEQDGATQDYRQRVVGIARDITRLRRESEVAASNEQFPLPRRRPYLWRSRIRLIGRALAAWQGALSTPADPQRMGLTLFELRGALNTASVAPVEFSLLSLLTYVALWLTPLSGLAAGMASIASALSGQVVVAASLALVTLLAFMLWCLLLLLASRGRVTLAETLAGICFSETRSACNGRGGSRLLAVGMRVWWLLIGVVGALLTLAALAGSGYALNRLGLLATLTHGLPAAPPAALQLIAGLLALVVAPAALVATAALVALALPALLISALRFAAEMGGSRRWVPGARRYALPPALTTLAYLTGTLVALAWPLATRLGLPHRTLLSGSLGADSAHALTLLISERAPLLALALALPYLLLIELPFRLGLGNWRRAWLRDLRTRHATIEAHVRRLSAPDPRTGAPDTSDETLRAMQYDLVLLQFYSARIVEAERAPAAPLRLGAALAMLVIIVAGALLLDGSAQLLSQAFAIRLTP